MSSLRRGVDGQAIGLLPLLVFVFVGYFFSYTLSFVVGFIFCALSGIIFRWLRKGEVYQFMLLPVTATFLLYSICLIFRLESILTDYSALIIEISLILVLTIIGLLRRFTMRKVKRLKITSDKLSSINATLNEFYSVAQITQNLYTLHLFAVLFYFILPAHLKNPEIAPLLFQHSAIILGLFIIFYEQIRLLMLRNYLRKEVWLPVLNERGSVIGRIARSISAVSARKFYHPVVRIVLLHDGMLYLAKRNSDEIVSPDTLDYPFRRYVKFKQTIEDTVAEAIAPHIDEKSTPPRFLIKYTFENETVKHLVAVYVINVVSEEMLKQNNIQKGKLWTAKQIEENIGTGIFSEYFEKEFSYLQNTVLLAEKFLLHKLHQEDKTQE